MKTRANPTEPVIHSHAPKLTLVSTVDVMDEKALHNRNLTKLEAAKAYLGRKWLLHPENKDAERIRALRQR